MSKRHRATLINIAMAVICAPMGFAIARATGVDESPIERRQEDPNPATDLVQVRESLNKARDEGNAAAEVEAFDGLYKAILARLSPAEREAAESAPQEAAVPPGTRSYLPPSTPAVLVDGCRDELAKGSENQLCQLIVLHAEGKIRSGAFSAEQQRAALAGAM